MNPLQFLTLVRLFWQQLLRRKSLWIVMTVAGLAVLVNYWIGSELEGMLESGVRYDIATRQAAASLEAYAGQARLGSLFVVLVIAALVAPMARRDGTVQFLITLSVGRGRLALAQFTALALFVFVAVLVLHVGTMTAAHRLGVMQWSHALLAWPLLLLPLLAQAAASFALSLTRPAVLVYAILLGVPFLLLPIGEAFVGSWEPEVPRLVRLLCTRAIDSAELLFPSWSALIPWPDLVPQGPERPPHPAWGLEGLHSLAASAFWVTLGLWAYRNHDLGSRLPTK